LTLSGDEQATLQRWARRAKSSQALALRANIIIHLTPTSSSWLNQVERWFGLMTEKLLRRGVHKSVRQLEKDILAWVDKWNEDPSPFIWTKSAEEILESLGRLLRRIKDPGH
jgi:hypothetical protein